MQVIRAAIADTAAEDSMGSRILNKEDCLMIRKILRSTLPLLAIAATGLLFMTACQDNSTSAPGAETVNSRRAKDSAIHAAAERNDDETIRQLIGQGTNPNTQLKNGRTPLHLTAANSGMRAASA